MVGREQDDAVGHAGVAKMTRTAWRMSSLMTSLALCTFLVLAGYKLWVIGPSEVLAWTASESIDALTLGLIWLAGLWLEGRSSRRVRLAGRLLFFPAVAIVFLANFAYAFFFGSATTRHLSLLDIGLGQVSFFFEKMLPWDGWLWLAVLAAAIAGGAILLTPRLSLRALRRPLLVVVAEAVVAAVLVFIVPDIPSPAVDMVQDVRERFTLERVAFDPGGKPAAAIALFDKSHAWPATLKTRFTKIIVVVMETMPLDTFREEVADLDRGNFLVEIGHHAHSFEDYHATNQDSRTGMLAMLVSRFIPYEAYDDAELEHYQNVSRLANLPAHLHALGYETAYALAQEDREAVVAQLPWQEVISLTQAQITALKPRALCFNPYEFENSCEDKVLLPAVTQFLAGHEKAFVYQEMMWGHDEDYNKVSGKGNAEYYAEYLDALWKELQRLRIADKTLLVLTSDHGDKWQGRLLDPEAYHLPLFFYAASFGSRRQLGMYSHLDFADLLLRELDPRRARVPTEPFVQVVGPTGTQLRVVLDADGSFLAYKQRGEASYVMSRRGRHVPDLNAHLRLFEDYRRAFEKAAQP